MTNEELATQIHAGERDALLVLWAQVKRFARGWATRWERALGVRGGVTVDDLMQAAFLALLDALERWDPERGAAFITYFGMCLKGAFAAACGVHTARAKQDPLRLAASLDAPADPSDPDGCTLGDLQPDPEAEEEIHAIAETDRQAKLHKVTERALGQLPAQQRDTLRWYFYQNRSLTELAAIKGVSVETIRMRKAQGLRALRHPSVSQELRKFL